ncbi:hypothetical protein [Dyadobacter sp. NIV53]|uniref:hypothetical protein n=1 Tax=Dyadobacter sp. NIV53 TaxID=2861765 RepID=UPI001C87C6CD|nr:hypothetical protein [Dyadobacter sp. NIV53]
MQKKLPFVIIKFKIRIVIFILLAFQSCHSPDTEPVNPYDYFPLEVGSFQVYSVTEEVYSAGQKAPTVKMWYEKNEIIRMNKDSDVGSTFTVSHSVRNNPSDYWQKIKEYSVQSSPDKIIQNQDNEIFTSLVFPYSPTVQWDGYQYFNMDKNDPRKGYLFHYEDLNQPVTIDSIKFDRTLKVSERSDTTFKSDSSSREFYRLGFKQYAIGVGMIADVQADFEYLQENGEFIGYRIIGSGTRRIKKIIAFGR